jgi:hypothetical protein
MNAKNLNQCEEDWKAAEAALKAAQKMPGGPERVEALRRAGQLRYNADQHRRALEDRTDRGSRRA